MVVIKEEPQRQRNYFYAPIDSLKTVGFVLQPVNDLELYMMNTGLLLLLLSF